MTYLRLGVLVSGRGTNLAAVLGAIQRGELKARVVVVASNRPEAPALHRAREVGIPTIVAPRSAFGTRREQQLSLARALQERGVELVVLAGFDQILGPEFLDAFPQRIINLHPSLLPSFGGTMHAVAEALAHGVKVTGCTVHFVTSEVDAGPIIVQECVPVHEDDTVETLAARVREREHVALPRAINLIAEGKVRVEGRRVRILET
ncbi:MAG TPA: phosphoribosylglycinamide formyltransferase [Chloroflexota bacterium]|jgi:phosphoribosylglycinamide formyltransferase-1